MIRNLTISKTQKTFLATLEDCFELLQKDVDFDMIGYRQKYASVIDQPPLLLKELHSLLESHKVPNDEMGKEMDNPCMEACFVCDALFEKNQGEAVKIPFCGHRAHIECLRRESTPICQFCGNGIRSSLYSSIKSTQIMEKTLNEANKQSNDENDALLDIEIPQAVN